MSVQNTYGYATGKGIAGGIHDMYHYQVDSRFNEEGNDKLRFGVGVVVGTIPGSNIALPTAESTGADFEGVVVNGFSQQQDLEGKLFIMNNQNIGVMRRGRIWARLGAGAEPAYGDSLFLITEGDDAGCFATEGGLEIPGRFIGAASRGLAPIELYGIEAVAADAPVVDPGTQGGGEETAGTGGN